jgi:hypothetical protein
MARLLWLEWRSKRVWALLLAASLLIPIFLGHGYCYSFLGQPSGVTLWHFAAFIMAVLLGTATFGSELAEGTADFVCSRPISWKKMLLAKLLVGLGIVAAGALLAVVASALLRPERYAGFVTPLNLAAGVAYAARQLGIAYLIGAGCAVALPGVVGGILTVLAAGCGMMVYTLAIAALIHGDPPGGEMIVYLWATGAALVTVLAARSWLTLPTGARVGRYALVVLGAVVVGTPAVVLVRDPAVYPWQGGYLQRSSISPDGRYAFTTVFRGHGPVRERGPYAVMLRLSDGARAEVRLPAADGDDLLRLVEFTHWTRSSAAFFNLGGRSVCIFRMYEDGTARLASVEVPGSLRHGSLVPSPDGKLAIVPTRSELRVVDIEGARLLKTTIAGLPVADLEEANRTLPDSGAYWWQSNTEVGHVDARGQRRIVQITD